MKFKKKYTVLVLFTLVITSSLLFGSSAISYTNEPNNSLIDSDGDLISDYLENSIYGTSSDKVDTDGDGMWDGYEILCGVDNGGWQDPLIYNERYAVLIVGGWNETINYARYWNSLVLMYDILILGYNYKPENIFVFYANDKIPNIDNMPLLSLPFTKSISTHREMVDFDAENDTITNFLTGVLKNLITKDDSLFFWVCDHGFYDGHNALINCWYSSIYDDELYDCLKDYEYAQATFIMDFCFSSGFLDPSNVTGYVDPNDNNTENNLNDLSGKVIVLTAQDFRNSHSSLNTGFMHHFCKGILPGSIYNFVPFVDKPSFNHLMSGRAYYDIGRYTLKTADCNRNHFVSLYEAFEYTRDNNDWSSEHFLGAIVLPLLKPGITGDIVQYYESEPGLGKNTYL